MISRIRCLVREQFDIADSRILSRTDDPKPRGHMIAFRINGGGPRRDRVPIAGTIPTVRSVPGQWRWAATPVGVRYRPDVHLSGHSGYLVDMPKSPEPLLTRERIIAVALRLVDTEGLAKLSTRRVAKEMGVSSPALYYHFDSMDDILVGVIREAMRSMSEPDPNSQWTDQVTLLSYSYRETLIAHPNLAPVMVRHPYRRFGGGVIAGLARAMAADGMPARLIPAALSSFESYVFGAGVSAQADYEEPLPNEMPELDDFPDVAAALLTAQNNAVSFGEGLQSLIAGWQARTIAYRQQHPAGQEVG
jgi:AcrR family transcriptional regulator